MVHLDSLMGEEEMGKLLYVKGSFNIDSRD